MSVMVSGEGGPSYILHDLKPGKGRAVCADCVYVNKQSYMSKAFCEGWTCRAVPETVLRPAGTDPISGEKVDAWTKGTRCTERNPTGECKDFVRGANPDQPAGMAEADDHSVVFVAGMIFGVLVGAGAMAVLS